MNSSRILIICTLISCLLLGAGCNKTPRDTNAASSGAVAPADVTGNSGNMSGSSTTTNMATSSGVITMTAKLDGASEVPPLGGNGVGSVDVTIDKQSGVLTYTLNYIGLSGVATAAHFHGPALAGKNAGVAVPITGNLSSPVSGSVTLTSAQSAELLDGKWYVNVHTAKNPNGEIRGQVIAKP